MAAVAHSPSFAKKVGVPQKVGKDFTAADKGRKFNSGGDNMNPRARFMGGKIKKMAGGGETAYDDMSFSAAWRAARKDKGAGEVFTYKGKDYSTNTEEEGVGMRRQIPREGKDTSETGPSRGALGKSRADKTEDETPFLSRGKDQAAGAALSRSPKLSAPKDEGVESVAPESYLLSPEAKALGIGSAALGATAMKYAPKLAPYVTKMTKMFAPSSRVGKATTDEVAENLAAATAKRSATAKAAAAAKKAKDAERRAKLTAPLKEAKDAADKARLDRIAKYEDEAKEAYRGMRTGGKVDKVKAYAKGGSVRGGGCESKGKTKGKFR